MLNEVLSANNVKGGHVTARVVCAFLFPGSARFLPIGLSVLCRQLKCRSRLTMKKSHSSVNKLLVKVRTNLCSFADS